MKQTVNSVIDLNFGDCGKGLAVDYICSKSNVNQTLVVRHSGGHQVGHTVRMGEIIHEFRHFGAGSMRGVATYWDKACTVSPIGFMAERDVLQMKGIVPKLFVHDLCPVTTPWDIAYNRYYNKQLGAHQTVGVGFASTLIRHETLPLYAKDLYYPEVFEAKMNSIINYYVKKVKLENSVFFSTFLDMPELTKFSFKEYCNYFIENTIFVQSDNIIKDYIVLVFEGNQGILLDKDHGIQPYVTHGKTTNYNLRNFNIENVNKWYVSRCYLTRHGDGPMLSKNDVEIKLKNNEDESNFLNENQGEFRIAPLNLDLLRYSLNSDYSDYPNYQLASKENIILSCLDQMEDINNIPYILNGKLEYGNVADIIQQNIGPNLYVNTSSESKTIKKWNIK